MKTIFSLLFILVQFVSIHSFADIKIAEFSIPEKISIEKKDLQLNGTAFRKVSMFNVKVWLSALYLETLETQAEMILDSKAIKVIDLYPMYEISAADSVKGWKLAFDDNCELKCTLLKPEIARFMSAVTAFKKGDRYRYIFLASEVKFELNEKEVFHSKSPDFTRLLLSTWIGNKPPTVEVKQGLLRGSAKL